MIRIRSLIYSVFLFTLILTAEVAFGQPPNDGSKPRVRTVSIPISIFTKQELKEDRLQEFIQIDKLIVKEDKDEQTILSIRSIEDAPLALAILIQDDLTSNFNLQLKDLAKFIRSLPRGSRVMVAYTRGGSPQIRQRFTDDLNKAADSLRIVLSSSSAAPRSPYDGVVDILNRFDALPAGRRAILLVSDGLDLSSGLSSASPGQSIELDKAILRAQRRSVAVFSIYSPSSSTENENSRLILFGQGSLQKLSDETGGRAFFQGSIAPISFEPFFRDLSILLNRQFLLTYLSTHMKKGYYKVEVTSTNPGIKIEHPKGYYYR
jgi:VWFA-related protein